MVQLALRLVLVVVVKIQFPCMTSSNLECPQLVVQCEERCWVQWWFLLQFQLHCVLMELTCCSCCIFVRSQLECSILLVELVQRHGCCIRRGQVSDWRYQSFQVEDEWGFLEK